jgi:hypothetical protein
VGSLTGKIRRTVERFAALEIWDKDLGLKF